MRTRISVRELQRDDLQTLSLIVDQTGLFPSEMLLSMAEPYFSGEGAHQWLVAVSGERVIGLAYIEPERMTEGTYNLLLIAVEPQSQRMGVGRAIVADLLERLRKKEGRLLLVETSSLDQFAATRSFYERQNFTNEARIRDFYTAGEDKIIFRKNL